MVKVLYPSPRSRMATNTADTRLKRGLPAAALDSASMVTMKSARSHILVCVPGNSALPRRSMATSSKRFWKSSRRRERLDRSTGTFAFVSGRIALAITCGVSRPCCE